MIGTRQLRIRALICLVFAISVVLAGCSDSSTASPGADAKGIVASQLDSNQLDVTADDLEEMSNPRGEGTFVYVAQTRFAGVERYLLWLVIDDRPFALNGAAKDVTPSVDWPRDAPPGTWERTNLDPYSAAEAISIIFGGVGPEDSTESGAEQEVESADRTESESQQSFTVAEYRIYRAVMDTPMTTPESQALEDAAALYGVSQDEATIAVSKVQGLLFANGWFGSPESEIQRASDWSGESP